MFKLDKKAIYDWYNNDIKAELGGTVKSLLNEIIN